MAVRRCCRGRHVIDDSTRNLPEKSIFKVKLPGNSKAFRGAHRISSLLREAGFETWLAGGSVRDLIMGIEPHDFDIATSARPEQVIELFDRTIPVGMQFGVVIVRMYGADYEVATFRADCGYSDGRRPDEIRFTDLREDVLRRDFTINGLVMDADDGHVIDLVDGVTDIRKQVIRAIGNPDERFEEDRLRQMRAVRFAAQTGFRIEERTLSAIAANAGHITKVSGERISEEYRKMLMAPNPVAGLRLAAETGLLKHTLPELDASDIDLALRLVDAVRNSGLELMWAALLYCAGPAAATGALKRLKRSNNLCEATKAIITDADDLNIHDFEAQDVAADKRLIRRPWFHDAVKLLEAVKTATNASDDQVTKARKRLEARDRNDLFPVQLVTGNDVISAGVAKGPEIAVVLESVEDGQLRGDIRTLDQAKEFIAAWKPEK